jgi:tetratricopeptide (TPR) repeat protein
MVVKRNRCEFLNLLRMFAIALVLFTLIAPTAFADDDGHAILNQRWFETRTRHFNVYSCGPIQDVYRAAARLEQFREAYGLLAGERAVTAPPITVMIYPDHEQMEPFLPRYQDKPANLSGFFTRNDEENLIVMELSGTNTMALNTIFHEYTHLLLRNNDQIWPVWLQEGMAEIYSTFETTGRGIRIGKPINYHLRFLAHSGLIPLKELFSVDHDSPQYNEAELQGTFYAESWLLTHFLMNGDNPVLKARFAQFTPLLRLGESPEQAFTNALRMPLTQVDAELHRYLERGQFESITAVVPVDLSTPQAFSSRLIGKAEACFHLGDQLMRIQRFDAARDYFMKAQKIAPASPLSYEGLGLLAALQEKPAEAVARFKESFAHGSTNFLAYFACADQQIQLASDADGSFSRLKESLADEISVELQKAISLMPSFGPAQELLGQVELVQGRDPAQAEQHMETAIRLEPEKLWYLLPLAQAQILNRNPDAARQTLESLRRPYVESKLRARAESALSELDLSAH